MEQRHAAPTSQRPDGQPCGSIAASIGCDPMTTAMLTFVSKSNGKAANSSTFRGQVIQCRTSALLDGLDRPLFGYFAISGRLFV